VNDEDGEDDDDGDDDDEEEEGDETVVLAGGAIETEATEVGKKGRGRKKKGKKGSAVTFNEDDNKYRGKRLSQFVRTKDIYGKVLAREDFYKSSVELVKIVIHYVQERMEFRRNILVFDPVAGDGIFEEQFREEGYERFISRDLYPKPPVKESIAIEKADFLYAREPDYDVAVLNPPFCLKKEMLLKCLQNYKPFIMVFPMEV